MEIIEQKQNDICIFKINGRLDSNTSPELEEKIFGAIKNESNQMIIDFEDLDYISSAGLRVILKTSKTLKRSEGSIVLCSMQDYVKEVFEIAGFDVFLSIAAKMNAQLRIQIPVGNFVACTLISIDPVNRSIEVWNGGSPDSFFISKKGEILSCFIFK